MGSIKIPLDIFFNFSHSRAPKYYLIVFLSVNGFFDSQAEIFETPYIGIELYEAPPEHFWTYESAHDDKKLLQSCINL